MFLIITRDTMFFTAMKNILSKGNVVHIQNEEEIDVMLHQNAFVIIDTLMNNVFHSNFLTQIERLKPVHVIIFSPFNIKRCLGKVPVTFVPRTIAIIDFVALINGSYCSVPEADVSLSRKQHQVLSCIANQMTTEDILEKLKISLKTFYCHKHRRKNFDRNTRIGQNAAWRSPIAIDKSERRYFIFRERHYHCLER